MNKKIANIFKGDRAIWMIFFFLCVISIVEVFSASSGLTYKSNDYITPIAKHMGTMVAGILLMLVVTNIQCRFFKLVMPVAIVFSAITLVMVLFVGESVNGANRTLFGFQPSEIAKGSLILAEAQILSKCQTDSGTDPIAFKIIMAVSILFCLLIGNENLSTAVLLFGVVYIMMFIGRVSFRQLGWVAAIGGGIVAMALALILLCRQNCKIICKPNSVWGGYLSGRIVADTIERYRRKGGQPVFLTSCTDRGLHCHPRCRRCGGLLPHLSILTYSFP